MNRIAGSGKVVSFETAAELIPDFATVTVDSSSGLGCPDRMLRAIGERYRQTGYPIGLTTVHPIAAGDMYGIDGIDHLAIPGLLKRVIAGSFPSGPSSKPSPKIWQLIHANEIEAYNIPSGILFQLHTQSSMPTPGVLTHIGMGTYLDPRQSGGKMNAATTEDIVEVVEFDGKEWLYFRKLSVDIAIIRGTSADVAGNISMEHEGAYLGSLEQAICVRNQGGVVIAQVERVVESGSLPAQSVRVPENLVDVVVVDEDQAQTTMTRYDPAISGEIRRPAADAQSIPFGPEKVIARRAAMELQRGEAVNLGFGISARIPAILLEEGLEGAVTWVIEQGAVGGTPLDGFQFGCAVNAKAIVPSPAQFTYFQGGGFDRAFLSFLQVGPDGSVNVSKLAAKPHVTAGVGGFVDITSNARTIVFSGTMTAGGLDIEIADGEMQIRSEGRNRKFTTELEQVSFNGSEAAAKGQEVLFVTERCVIELRAGALTVTEIAPGIDLDRDVLAQCGFPLTVSDDLEPMDPRLFREPPIGLRLVEKQPRTVPERLVRHDG